MAWSSDGTSFEQFFATAEPRLRRALVATYGGERGREASAEALAWAWEHWPKVQAMEHPLGRCIGNAIEVEEAIEVLAGRGDPDLEEVSLAGALRTLLDGTSAGARADALALPTAQTFAETMFGRFGR